jgi:hypothetical protein
MDPSDSTRLGAISALRGQCLNGHPDVMRDLYRGMRTPEAIAHAREAQAESLSRFVKENQKLFTALSSGDRPHGYREWIVQSIAVIWIFPPEKQQPTGMTPTRWQRGV